MFKAIIFDLDDTLIDFRERKKELIRSSVKAMISAGLKEEYKELYSEFSEFYWRTGIEDQNIFEKFLFQKYGSIDYRVLAHAVVAYRKANAKLLKTYPDVKETLLRLRKKGFKLAVLSDAPRLGAWIRLVETELDDIFDVVVTYDDVGKTKPATDGFKMVIERLGVDAASCLMVGDNPSRDVVGARNAGVKICLAAYSCSEDVIVDYRIKDIKELEKVVGK